MEKWAKEEVILKYGSPERTETYKKTYSTKKREGGRKERHF